MDQESYARLNKVMMLTQSDNDAEALSALRKANHILKQNDANWDTVFQGRTSEQPFENPFRQEPQKRSSPKPRPRYQPPPDSFEDIFKESERRSRAQQGRSNSIEDAFRIVLAGCSGGFRNFIASLQEFYAEHGELTAKQESALFAARDRALSPQKRRARERF